MALTTRRSLPPNPHDQRTLPWDSLPTVVTERLKGAGIASISDWRKRGRSVFGIPRKLAAVVDSAIEESQGT